MNKRKKITKNLKSNHKRLTITLQLIIVKKGYAPRNPLEVTKQEFNHHYWAIANELLSKDELGMLNSTNFSEYEQNSDGFYMIPIGENGVLNKIVFTDGKQDYYSINHIIEIYANNETDLSDIRRIIYDGENNGISTQDTELLQTYTSKTYSYNDFVREISQDKGNSSSKQDGRGSSRKTQFSLKTTEYKKVLENLNEVEGWCYFFEAGGNFNERSDDFRRIQRESLSMSENERQSFRNGSKVPYESLRGRLSTIFRREIIARSNSGRDGYESVVKTNDFTVLKNIDAQLFKDIFEINKIILQKI